MRRHGKRRDLQASDLRLHGNQTAQLEAENMSFKWRGGGAAGAPPHSSQIDQEWMKTQTHNAKPFQPWHPLLSTAALSLLPRGSLLGPLSNPRGRTANPTLFAFALANPTVVFSALPPPGC